MNVLNTTHDPIPRPTAETRLHLYAAGACPFCHRVLAALALTGLRDRVTITWMRNIKGPGGWEIAPGDDPLFGETSLARIYRRMAPGRELRPSVPLLVDLASKTLLSSSSSQLTRFIARGMNGAFPVTYELAPFHLARRIDRMNAWLHDNVNRAVYGVGFAHRQRDYEAKVSRLFASLDALESSLQSRSFLLGHTLTESDLFLLPTLVRFDAIYHPLFRCAYRRVSDYPALSAYLRRLLQIDALKGTYDHERNKQHYYCSVMHVGGEVLDLNPSRLVPVDSLGYERSPGGPISDTTSV